MPRLHPVHPQRFVWSELDSISRWVLGDKSESQNDGDIVARLLRQRVGLVQLPEIGVAGAFDGVLYGSRPGIVRGHHQIPIAKHAVQVSQMASRGPSRFLRILTLIHPPAVLQAVLLAAVGHELPEPPRARPRQS